MPNFKKGFTLIELLVVISIIAILVASATVSWRNAQMKGRDGKRKVDLKALQQALETYLQANGKYPQSTSNVIEAYKSNANPATWLPGLYPTYISALPLDSVNDAVFYYWYCVRADHLKYVLGTKVENLNDGDIAAGSQNATSPLPVECSNSGVNYFVGSP